MLSTEKWCEGLERFDRDVFDAIMLLDGLMKDNFITTEFYSGQMMGHAMWHLRERLVRMQLMERARRIQNLINYQDILTMTAFMKDTVALRNHVEFYERKLGIL